jgi:hypothetical protein
MEAFGVVGACVGRGGGGDRGACLFSRARRRVGRSRAVYGTASSPSSTGEMQEFPSECDRATRSSTMREHRVDHTGAMPDSASDAPSPPTPSRGSGWPDHGDAEFFRIESGRITAMQNSSAPSATGPPSGTRPERSSHRPSGGGLSPRSGRRSPIRVLPGGQALRFNR